MRDIEFRAYNRGQKKMYSWEEIIDAKGEHSFLWLSKQKNYSYNILEQHTGLLDKNGVKIFEGDIVKCETTIYTCKWNNHRCEFAWYSDNSYIYPLGDMRTFLEVIGNIHEK